MTCTSPNKVCDPGPPHKKPWHFILKLYIWATVTCEYSLLPHFCHLLPSCSLFPDCSYPDIHSHSHLLKSSSSFNDSVQEVPQPGSCPKLTDGLPHQEWVLHPVSCSHKPCVYLNPRTSHLDFHCLVCAPVSCELHEGSVLTFASQAISIGLGTVQMLRTIGERAENSQNNSYSALSYAWH